MIFGILIGVLMTLLIMTLAMVYVDRKDKNEIEKNNPCPSRRQCFHEALLVFNEYASADDDQKEKLRDEVTRRFSAKLVCGVINYHPNDDKEGTSTARAIDEYASRQEKNYKAIEQSLNENLQLFVQQYQPDIKRIAEKEAYLISSCSLCNDAKRNAMCQSCAHRLHNYS